MKADFVAAVVWSGLGARHGSGQVHSSQSTAYSRRRAKELEQDFRNGDVSYEDACLEMEQLDGEP